MALKKFEKDLYGQIEVNFVAWRRDGRIEAQCKLDEKDFSKDVPAENGMLLAVDALNRRVKFPKEEVKDLPIAVHQSTEHLYDERKPGLKNFCLTPEGFLPKLGYPSAGDTFTTNTLCYDDTEFADDLALEEKLADLVTNKIYGGVSDIGYIKLSATKPAFGPVFRATQKTTMPDGQLALELHCLEVQ